MRASYSSSTRNTRSSNHSLWEFVMVPKYLVGYLVICAQIALRMCIFSNHSTFQEATPERASVFRPQLLPSFRNARRHWGAALCVPQAYEAPRSPSATPAMRVRAFPNERALRRARWFRGPDGSEGKTVNGLEAQRLSSTPSWRCAPRRRRFDLRAYSRPP